MHSGSCTHAEKSLISAQWFMQTCCEKIDYCTITSVHALMVRPVWLVHCGSCTHSRQDCLLPSGPCTHAATSCIRAQWFMHTCSTNLFNAQWLINTCCNKFVYRTMVHAHKLRQVWLVHNGSCTHAATSFIRAQWFMHTCSTNLFNAQWLINTCCNKFVFCTVVRTHMLRKFWLVHSGSCTHAAKSLMTLHNG
jgi:hypothetical protein